MFSENSTLAGINYILNYIKTEIRYFKLYYFKILLFYCIFDQINAILVSIFYPLFDTVFNTKA